MKNRTRKMKGAGKRRRVEELPEIESVLEIFGKDISKKFIELKFIE